MKKVFVLLCMMVAMFATPVVVYAANDFNVDCSGATDSPVCQDLNSTGNPLFGADGVLTKVAKFFALLTGIISGFMIIISGLRYVTSAGDPAKTTSARNGIMYSAIGMLVSAVAGAIALFILSKVS